MPTHVHEISHPAALVTAHMAHLHHRDLEAAADTMAQMKRVLELQDLVGLWAGATSVLLRMAGVSPGPESNITVVMRRALYLTELSQPEHAGEIAALAGMLAEGWPVQPNRFLAEPGSENNLWPVAPSLLAELAVGVLTLLEEQGVPVERSLGHVAQLLGHATSM